jgi:pimeloyl-ACP methyl ester carboxylesterase
MKRQSIGDVELALVDEGSGPAVVLVHGFPLDHSMWSAQIESLAPRFRVIVPDLRGFGQSDVTEGTVSMDRLADDVAALLDAIGVDGPVVLGGLSMGGYVAWEFWRRHGRRLRGLVLCDTRASADTAEAAANRMEVARRVLAEGRRFLAESMIPKLFSLATQEHRPERIESVRRVILATDPRGIAAASRGMAERADATSWLGRIECPALVLCGAEDGLSPPEEMRRIAESMPCARFVEIGDAGHMAPLENGPHAGAAMLEFLDGLAG